jgi:hypothetical protein
VCRVSAEAREGRAAADGRQPERPDTAESQFYDNRARAQGNSGTPWAEHTAEQQMGRLASASEYRPSTPWADDNAMTASDAAAVAAAGRSRKV